MSTSDDFIFVACGGGDGGLGKVSPSSTDFSDDAPSSRVSWTSDSGMLFSLLPPC
jgi:hypothetical protein